MRYKFIIIILTLSILSGCSFNSRETQPIIPKVIPKTQVLYYLPVNKNSENFNEKLVPAGSLIVGCEDYLTLRKGGFVISSDRADILQSALSQIFLMDSNDNFYHNPIFTKTTLTLESIDYKDDFLEVKIKGSLDVDSCTKTLITNMIYHTISQNYDINKVKIYINNELKDSKNIFN